MKEFLKKSSKFLGIVVLIAVLLELYLSYRYKQGHVDGEDWHLLKKVNADYVFIGNSRIKYNIHQQYLRDNNYSSVSITCAAADYDYLKNKAQFYSRYNTKADLAILLLEEKMFNYRHIIPMKGSKLRYMFMNNDGINEFIKQVPSYRKSDQYIPLFRYSDDHRRLFKHLFGEMDTVNRYGWKGVVKKVDSREYLPDTISTQVFDSLYFQMIEVEQWVKEYVADSVVWIIPPHQGKFYLEVVEKTDILNTNSFLKEEDSVFMDEGHLNTNGALIYTKILINRLNLKRKDQDE